MVNIKDIEKLAELSRLDIPDDEKEGYVQDMDAILGLVDQLQRAEMESGKKDRVPPDHRNEMREDSDPHEGGLFTERIIRNAPETDGGYVAVKKNTTIKI